MWWYGCGGLCVCGWVVMIQQFRTNLFSDFCTVMNINIIVKEMVGIYNSVEMKHVT